MKCEHKLCSQRDNGCENDCNRFQPVALHRDGYELCSGIGYGGKMLDLYMNSKTQKLQLSDNGQFSVMYDTMADLMTALKDGIEWEDK